MKGRTHVQLLMNPRLCAPSRRLIWWVLCGLVACTPLFAASAKSEWKEIQKLVSKVDEMRRDARSGRSDLHALGAGGGDFDPVVSNLALLKMKLELFIRDRPEDDRWSEAKVMRLLILPDLARGLRQEFDDAKWWAEVEDVRALAKLNDNAHLLINQLWFNRSSSLPPGRAFTAAEVEALVTCAEEFVRRHSKDGRSISIALTAGRLIQAQDEMRARVLLEHVKKLAGRFDVKAENEAEQALAVLAFRHAPTELQFKAADGREVDLAALRGKVVVVDFWASWCPPCRDEAPEIAALYRKYRDAGLEIVGVSLDKDRKKMEAFAQDAGMTWPHYFDGGGWETKLSRRFAIASIPTVWVIGRDGRLVDNDARGKLERLVPQLLQVE